MNDKPTFEATFPDGEIKGTLKIGNETISVYIAKMSVSIEMDDYRAVNRIDGKLCEKFERRKTIKRKFILIEE